MHRFPSALSVLFLGLLFLGCGDSDGNNAAPPSSPTPAPSNVTFAVPQNIPTGQVGGSYYHQLQVTDGTQPYTFSTYMGALPDGVTLSSTGVVSGVPTVAGTVQVGFRCVDSASGTATYVTGIAIDP